VRSGEHSVHHLARETHSNFLGRSIVQGWQRAPSISAKNIDSVPTLFGAAYTVTFENMNIERSLQSNQENSITRGVQLNYTFGPLAVSFTWNNGFYSHSYTWVDGSLGWTIDAANTLTFVGGGQAGFAKSNNFATPLFQNNSQIYDLIYEYRAWPWIINPSFQLALVPHNPEIGVFKTTSTIGGAIRASYAVTNNCVMVGRTEFIGQNGNMRDGAANLLHGQATMRGRPRSLQPINTNVLHAA
jgi:hypothetical protein